MLRYVDKVMNILVFVSRHDLNDSHTGPLFEISAIHLGMAIWELDIHGRSSNTRLNI